MCGRYTTTTPADVLAAQFAVDEVALDAVEARWNVAPTLDVPVVALRSSGARVLGAMRWGLVPSWAKDPSVGSRMINARADTVATKPAFRAAFERRRCVVPADAFYEWQAGLGKAKQPWAVRRRDGAPMAFAGLWEIWKDPAGATLRTCSIITTDANASLAPIHHRMPVVLDPADVGRWLTTPDPGLLVAAPDEWFEAFPVSPLVNKVTNEGPSLLEPAEPSPALEGMPLDRS